MKKNNNKNIAIFTFSLLAMVGTYNAVMINSGSSLGDTKNYKRMDEMLGVVTEGRNPAVNSQWTKISNTAVAAKSAGKVSGSVANEEASSVATIQDSLDMKLVEVINAKKWQNGLKSADFSGAIATNAGIIESLNASLPEGMNIEIAFSEMTGNTFEYDLNGEVYSGLMYQVDQGSYMVTMTNGPLEGTRLRFSGEVAGTEQAESYLAEKHNVEIGTFGEEVEAVHAEVTEEAPFETAEAASFNFNL